MWRNKWENRLRGWDAAKDRKLMTIWTRQWPVKLIYSSLICWLCMRTVWAHRCSHFQFRLFAIIEFFLLFVVKLESKNSRTANRKKNVKGCVVYACIKIHWQKHDLRGNHFVQYLQNILANRFIFFSSVVSSFSPSA